MNEIETLKAEVERLTKERDGYKVAMNAAQKVARDNEASSADAELIVSDLAVTCWQGHALPRTNEGLAAFLQSIYPIVEQAKNHVNPHRKGESNER